MGKICDALISSATNTKEQQRHTQLKRLLNSTLRKLFFFLQSNTYVLNVINLDDLEAILSKVNLDQYEPNSEQYVEEDSIKQSIHSNGCVGKSVLQ